jgi:hypothetical protein
LLKPGPGGSSDGGLASCLPSYFLTQSKKPLIALFRQEQAMLRATWMWATWMWATLPVNVNHHVGMTIKGKPRVVFLYMKKPELTSEGATKVAWRTLELTVDMTMPGADVAVLDVRRARLHLPTRKNRSQLDAWIESEALGYIEHWRRAA